MGRERSWLGINSWRLPSNIEIRTYFRGYIAL